jgi:uncharacterized protein with von Willebrand factor type A (vWA) domain
MRFDVPYDRLQNLPRTVWLPTLITAAGTREGRLIDAHAWLNALDAGEMPDARWDFGEPDAVMPLRSVVGELKLSGLTQGVPVLAEQVLRTLLWHLDRLNDLQPRLPRSAAIEQTVAEFREAWRVERAGVEAQLALLRDLADGAELTWDQLQGRLRPREWQAARKAADRLAALPAIAELLVRIGRRQIQETGARTPPPTPDDRSQRQPMKAEITVIPGAPGELTGIRFGADLSRMLASEASLLQHPVGRRLWRARLAEARLLSHDSQAELIDHRPDPLATHHQGLSDRPPAPLARGPIVLCLDTSGSMRGAPEQIAKAVALAAVRTARAHQRPCRLIAFGGQGELVEGDLTGPGGLEALLDLMGQSFDGGTDVQTPIERAIALSHEAGWHGADVLIVSDGEFGCVPATLQSLQKAQEQSGLQVYGVLVGDRETLGLLEVCDEIHWVRDWRRHVDPDEASASRLETRHAQPVHSKSLTALYFPNALSPRAAKVAGATLGGAGRPPGTGGLG